MQKSSNGIFIFSALVMDRLVLCLHCIIFQRESWLLAPVRFDKSCCPPTYWWRITSHEICPDAGVGCPGDMSIPTNLHLFPFLTPRPGVPLHTGDTGPRYVSPAQEATVLGMHKCPLRQAGQAARGPRWWDIQLSSTRISIRITISTTCDQNSSNWK